MDQGSIRTSWFRERFLLTTFTAQLSQLKEIEFI